MIITVDEINHLSQDQLREVALCLGSLSCNRGGIAFVMPLLTATSIANATKSQRLYTPRTCLAP